MNMYVCPHCERPGISGLRRAFMGPAIPAKCSQCGKKAGVPYWSMPIQVLPTASLMVAWWLSVHDVPGFSTDTVLGVFIGAMAAAITFVVERAFVPLERR